MGKILIVVLLLMHSVIKAQEVPDLDMDPIDLDPSQIINIESLTHELTNKKIDLNHDDLIILPELGLISEKQVADILLHKIRFGDFLSVLELQSVSSLTLSDIRKILPYVQVRESKESLSKEINQSISLSSTIRNSSSEESEQASLLLRYRGSAGNRISWGISAENDAKEKFMFYEQQYGFDHMSGFIEARTIGRFSRMVIGDYQIGLGQGLAIWNTFSRRPSVDIGSLKKITAGVKPNTGRNENNFFRGLAADYMLSKHLSVIGFISSHKADAVTIETDTGKFITSFPLSGYHATESELKSRKSANIKSIGGSVRFQKKRILTAVNMTHNLFQYPIQPSDKLHEVRNLSGNKNTVMSANYSSSFMNVDLFGEAAVSEEKNYALLQGALISAGPNLGLGVLYVKYSPGFHSFYHNAPGVFNKGSNEEGIHITAELRLTRKLMLQMMNRSSTSMLPLYGNNAPQQRVENRMVLTYTPLRKTSVVLNFTQKQYLRNSIEKEKILTPGKVVQKGIALNFDHSLTEDHRIALNMISRQETFNAEMMQSTMFSFGSKHMISKKLSIAGGVSYFEVDKGMSMYISEPGIPGVPSFTSVYGSGERLYVSTSVKLPWRMKLNLKGTVTKVVEREMDHSVSFSLTKGIT